MIILVLSLLSLLAYLSFDSLNGVLGPWFQRTLGPRRLDCDMNIYHLMIKCCFAITAIAIDIVSTDNTGRVHVC